MAARNFFVPGNHAFNSNGLAVPGATATLYGSGTTTEAAFYSDSGLSVSLGSTITANGAGHFSDAYGDDTVPYRLVLKDRTGATLDDIDPFYFGQTIVTVNANGATPEIDGAVGDNSTDDHTALQAWLDRGGKLSIGANCYYSSDNLILRKNAVIEGAGYGFDAREVDGTADLGYDNQPGSRIRFAAGKGFKVEPQTTVTDVATAVAAGTGGYTQEGAMHSRISNLGLIGAGTGASATGFYTRTLVHCDNVHVLKFQGKGFDISASADAADGNSEYGSADFSTFTNCHAIYNGSHGFHVRGREANVCKFDTCNAQLNGGWGFLNDAVEASSYINCHAATNTSGSYKASNVGVPHTFTGCYVESGTGQNCYLGGIPDGQCIVIGGNLASVAITNNGTTNKPNSISGSGSSQNYAYLRGNQDVPAAVTDLGVAFHTGNLGLVLQGGVSSGSNDVTLVNKSGTSVAYVPTGTTNFRVTGQFLTDSSLLINGNIGWPGIVATQAILINHATSGLTMGGTGSSYDLSLANKAGTTALRIPTNTTNVEVVGSLSVGGVAAINSSGVIQAAAFPALTGDVTTSAGALATTIANNAVTYAKMQNVSATDKVLGRSSSGAGDIEEITCTAFARSILDDVDAAAVRATIGAGAGSGDMLAANNLSDVADVPTARDNLDVPSIAEMAAAIAASGGGGGGTFTQFISGGQAIWVSGFQYRVTAATYYINGVLYSSAEQTITLDAADGTYDRIDVLALDDTGTLVKITGTAAAAPSEPDIDPATQIEVTFVTVATGTTAPATATNESVYLEDAEWTTSVTGTHITKNSTNNPRTGTKCIEATSAVTGDSILLDKGSTVSPSAYTALVFFIRNKTASWGTTTLRVHFQNSSGSRVGNIVTVSGTTYGFSKANTSSYQAISVPLTAFAIPATALLQKLNFAVRGSTAVGFYIDDMVLQLNGAGSGSSSGLSQTQADARYAQRSANLSDLQSASTALTNLGVSTFAKTILDDTDAATVRSTVGLGTIATFPEATAAQIQAGTASKAVAADKLAAASAPQTLTDGATISWDMSTGFNAKVTLGGNRTLAVSNPVVGWTYCLGVIQDGTGSRTMTWPASFDWGTTGAPTLTTTASKRDRITLFCTDAATPKFDAFLSGKGFS